MRKDIPNLTNLPPNIAQGALNNLSAGNQPMQPSANLVASLVNLAAVAGTGRKPTPAVSSQQTPVAFSAKQALWLVIAFLVAVLLFAFLTFGLN